MSSSILIKPSHYDDAGYVSQWSQSARPSHSLATQAYLEKLRGSEWRTGELD